MDTEQEERHNRPTGPIIAVAMLAALGLIALVDGGRKEESGTSTSNGQRERAVDDNDGLTGDRPEIVVPPSSGGAPNGEAPNTSASPQVEDELGVGQDTANGPRSETDARSHFEERVEAHFEARDEKLAELAQERAADACIEGSMEECDLLWELAEPGSGLQQIAGTCGGHVLAGSSGFSGAEGACVEWHEHETTTSTEDVSTLTTATETIPPALVETLVLAAAQAHERDENFINSPPPVFDEFDLLMTAAFWQMLSTGETLPPEVLDGYVAAAMMVNEGRWGWKVSTVATTLGSAGPRTIGSEQELVDWFETYLVNRFTARLNRSNQQLEGFVNAETAWRNVMSDIQERQQRQWTREQVGAAMNDANQILGSAQASVQAARFELGLA